MEEEKLNNLIYLLRIHHIDSEPLENLIKRNKELEEALKDEIQCFNKMKDIAETLRKENVEYIIQNRQYEFNYIPKSKVQELLDIDEIDVVHCRLKRLLEGDTNEKM